MKMTGKIEGLSKTLVKLKVLEKSIRADLKKDVYKAGTIVQARAKENINGEHGHTRHVKTGNLRRGILVRASWSSLYQIVAIIGTDVPYAPKVEALPDGGFLYPALVEVGGDALKYLKKQVGVTLKKW